MNYSSYSSTPGRGEYYYEKEAYASPSPTPSPRGAGAYYQQPQPTPRPATRAHFRNVSSGYNDWSSPRPPHSSPRYTSDGQYATFNVSSSRSARKSSFSSPRPRRERRSSYSYYRASDSHGESDEDEIIEIDGITYVLPARSRSSKRYSKDYYYNGYPGGRGTDQYYYVQVAQPSFEREASYATPRREPEGRRPGTSSRRASMSVPQSQPPPPRPQTARPPSAHKSSSKPATQAPSHRKATEADAKKHKIPSGYSLKNWDPAEEPILLLGSVFDANSLGKWVYDWTVFHHGPATPFADMAGEMWLLLIQLAGKIKRSDEIVPRIRSKENKEMVEDFIESGERLTDKLRKLLKLCESPMLKMQKKNQSSLGHNSGVEFVKTMFGRERELEKTERFMQSIRLWNLRFDANCEEILRHPTK